MLKMGMFSTRHYEFIAKTLGEAGAEFKAIWAIADAFEQDNDRFKMNLFLKRTAFHGGNVPSRYLED